MAIGGAMLGDVEDCAEDVSSCSDAVLAFGASLPWLAVRPGYHARGIEPRGVAVLAFGIGQGGAAWLREVEASAWFDGLRPDDIDLRVANATATSGCWMRPDLAAAGSVGLPYQHACLPQSVLATLALSADVTTAEAKATLALIRLLRDRRVAGLRTSVVVTSDAKQDTRIDALHRRLREAGAFVVTPEYRTPAAHLHGSPLRAAIEPRGGRLVCVDLADHLAAWPPGGSATLRCCDDLPMARAVLREDPARATSVIHWHPVSGQGQLADLDQLGQDATATGDMPLVLTTAERIDDVHGSVDLLRPLSERGGTSRFFRPYARTRHRP